MRFPGFTAYCRLHKDENATTWSKPSKNTLYALFVGLILLNTFDALATLFAVTAGHATEANPLMDYLLNIGPWAFLAYKLIAVNGLATIIAHYAISKRYALAIAGLIGLNIIYFGLMILHCYGLVYYS